jgi:hypothetical protein
VTSDKPRIHPEQSAEYIELRRRDPDEALIHAAVQILGRNNLIAELERQLVAVRALVEQWEQDSAKQKQAPRPDTNRGSGRTEYIMRSYTAAVYGDAARALREILDGE